MISVPPVKPTSVFAVRETRGKGVMPDGTSRFRITVSRSITIWAARHSANIPLWRKYHWRKSIRRPMRNRFNLLGCGVTTGSARYNTAKVQEGILWRYSASAVSGWPWCRAHVRQKQGRIFAIDTNPSKFELAKQFGATDRINPNDYDKPVQQVLVEMTKWGVDHTFECIGNVNVMRSALESAHRGWGSR